MNKIDKLLELYFKGESSLKQEKTLRKYFAGKNISAEHVKYIPLFTLFCEYSTESVKSNTHIGYLIKFGAIAACILISLSLFFIEKPFENDYKLLINGKNVKNKELAINMAKEKIGLLNKKIENVNKQAEKITKLLNKSKNIEIIN